MNTATHTLISPQDDEAADQHRELTAPRSCPTRFRELPNTNQGAHSTKEVAPNGDARVVTVATSPVTWVQGKWT